MRESERYNEYELVYMILQGDEHSLQLLLHQYQPKINAIIKQNCTYQVMIRHHEGDLHQVAAAALMRAVLEYREEKGISFSTFSGKVIRNASRRKRRVFDLSRHDGDAGGRAAQEHQRAGISDILSQA